MSDRLGVKKTLKPKENVSKVENTERRPRRANSGGFRDILTVEGQDPAFVYRWVSDKSENGQRIMRMQGRDYELVRSDEISQIGENRIYKSDNEGSLVRVPAGGDGDNFLYLMKIRKEWYEEDQKLKEKEIAEKEIGMMRDSKSPLTDELYGSVQIEKN